MRLPRDGERRQRAEDTAPDLPCFPIRNIVLKGDGAERFRFALPALPEDGAEPRCLGARGISNVLQGVQNAIVARGYVTTRVLAEPQDLKTGTLALTIIPGRIRAVRLDDNGTHRGTTWNALPTGAGQLLDLRDIEQGLENFKRVPSAEADIQIAPGEQPGESDLLIRWRQGFPLRVNLSADDSGSKATGKYQGSVTLSYDHWWTLNDLFYVTLNHDLGDSGYDGKGTRGRSVHYSVPMGYWLLALNASRNSYYQSVAGASQDYVYSGDSSNGDVKLSRLLHRDAVRKTTASLRGWARSSKNFIDDTEVEVQRRRMAGWEFGLAHREFIGEATLDASLAYRRGTGAQRAMRAPEEAFGEGTSRLRLATADAQFSLPFVVEGQRMRYSAAWRAQWNHTPLVPQDRFSIGSRYTVRGFDGETTLSSERGWLLRNDLGFAVPSLGAELYWGLDYGRVSGASAQQLLGEHLMGTVLGLRGAYQRVSYDVFAGVPLEKPVGYRTASTTAGFNLNWAY